MAKFTHVIHGNFDRILKTIEQGVLDASVSATLEDSWDVREGDSRCAVRVFERYSYAGGNRVSMNVTLVQSGGPIRLCAITSGGEVLGPDQRISAREAVKAYTTSAALCCAGEFDRGQLSPGRFADFVLLDRNIEESDPLTIRDIQVCATYCGGRKVYEA